MENKKIFILGAGLALCALTACGGGGSSAAAPPPDIEQGATVSSAPTCLDINNCVTSATGIAFPDANGGTITCLNSGSCTDSYGGNTYNVTPWSAYGEGYDNGATDGYNNGYAAGYSDGSSGDSVIGGSKDTDLQKSQIEQASLATRASSIAQQFGMSTDSAKQIVQLTDQVRQMALAGQMTAADRMAIATSALKIAGVTTDQVDNAIARAMKGDMSPTNDLMDQAARSLGMASGADVREKLLPSFGLVTN